MLAIVLFALQVATTPISPEATDLGTRLARASGLAAIAPALIEKDLSELAAEDKSLTSSERDRLQQIGRAQAKIGLDKVTRAIGAGYARRLSLADLRVLVAHAESPAAANWRSVEPLVIAEAAGTLGSLDLKKTTAALFCRETRKLCNRD